MRLSKRGADRSMILAEIDGTMKKHNILIFFLDRQLYIVIDINYPSLKRATFYPPSPFVKGCETGGAKPIRRLPRLVIAYC